MLPFYKKPLAVERSQIGGHLPLSSFEELPPFLQNNRFIRTGYRSMYNLRLCARSVLHLHNETINIWTHLVGALCVWYWLVSTCIMLGARPSAAPSGEKAANEPTGSAVVAMTYQSSAEDYLIGFLGYAAQECCFLFSAAYHTFNCQNEKLYYRWLTVDVGGICVGILGCYLHGLYFGFYCHWFWRDFYSAVIVLLCGLLILALLFDDKMVRKDRYCFLLTAISVLVASGLIPAAHWAYLSGGLTAEIVSTFLPRVLVFYAIFVFALVVYLTKFPERVFPGRFDLFFSSHQIWHLLIFFAFFWWHTSCQKLINYLKFHTCLP